MIIDSHAHIGEISFPVGKNRISSMPEEILLAAMTKYSVDMALVSSIEGAEFDSDRQLVAPENQVLQLESMHRLIGFINRNRSRLRALLWVKPYSEKCGQELINFIDVNREDICGLKIHPTLSNLKFTDSRLLPFVDLAKKYGFPILVHTEKDGLADPVLVEMVAKKYRSVNFIVAHLGLKTDNTEAIEVIKRNPNIYGDTCLVEAENVIRAIKECGSEKILFGTDTPVFGIDTYNWYMPMISDLKSQFTAQELDNVMFRNSVRLFRLSL